MSSFPVSFHVMDSSKMAIHAKRCRTIPSIIVGTSSCNPSLDASACQDTSPTIDFMTLVDHTKHSAGTVESKIVNEAGEKGWCPWQARRGINCGIYQKTVRNPNHHYFSKKVLQYASNFCFAVRLQFVLQNFRCH